MSLPLALGLTPETIAPGPYLRADAARMEAWRRRLPAPSSSRVGLAWAGNPAHENDRNRSMPLESLAPLLACGVQFISLQKEAPPRDEARLSSSPGVVRLETELETFTDTAALIAICDLVITVDTSVAHLAGALGRPVWILLPHFADWRWMTAEGDSPDRTPWYSTARLFRQRTAGDWGEVVARVADQLRLAMPG